MDADRYLVTCEHGGNDVPPRYRYLFEGIEHLLDTHEGYDPGALALAETLANTLAAPLVASTTTRLLVELNRSLGKEHNLGGLRQRIQRPLLPRVVTFSATSRWG